MIPIRPLLGMDHPKGHLIYHQASGHRTKAKLVIALKKERLTGLKDYLRELLNAWKFQNLTVTVREVKKLG